MNKNRIMILVAFMFTMSFLFVFSVVQGEEVALVNELDNDMLRVKFNKMKFQTTMKESDNLASARYELAIKKEKILQLKFDAAVKVEAYFSERAVNTNTEMDEQAIAITELTPLDIDTAKIVLKYANEYDLNPSLILGMMDLESSFSQYLVGTSQDRGYMQIIPGTEKWLATAYGEELGLKYDTNQIFEPEYNIALSVKYLDVLRQEFGLNYAKILTAYNRGTGGLNKWFRENNTYETAYSRVVMKRERKYLSIN